MSDQPGLASVVLPPKLWYFAGCSLAANAALAATGQLAKLRKTGGARSGRRNSAQISGFAGWGELHSSILGFPQEFVSRNPEPASSIGFTFIRLSYQTEAALSLGAIWCHLVTPCINQPRAPVRVARARQVPQPSRATWLVVRQVGKVPPCARGCVRRLLCVTLGLTFIRLLSKTDTTTYVEE